MSQFISRLNILTGQCAVPLIDGVKHKKLETGKDKGFAVTLVPESDSGPHMAKAGLNRYYKRSGDSFYMMEHFDIEDMFGRRKKPKLDLNIHFNSALIIGGTHYRLKVILGIKNNGRGSAKAPFLILRIKRPYHISQYGLDGNGNFGLNRLISTTHGNEDKFGGSLSVVIHPGTIHEVTAIDIEIQDRNNVQDLSIGYTLAAEDMRTFTSNKVVRAEELLRELDRLLKSSSR